MNSTTPVASFNGKYPMHELSPRQFEELTYLLLSDPGRGVLGAQAPSFTKAELMQGVGERGRDISLYDKTTVVGLIQCKHSSRQGQRLTRPSVIKEILKFLLHSYADDQLIPSYKKFSYILVTNVDFSEPAKTLLNNVSKELGLDLVELREYVRNIINSTKKLENIKVENKLIDWILDVAEKISFNRLIGVDLNSHISRHENEIAPLYFNVKKVIDSDLAARVTKLLEERLSGTESSAVKPIRDALAGYLTRSVITYRYMKTLAFRNQQILLKDLYQPLTLISEFSGISKTVKDYPEALIEGHQNILIRSTAGMGKSTLMRHIFISMVECGNCPRIPILIELRRLSRSNDLLSEILHRCDPLVGTSSDEFLKMLDEGAFVFLLDGYDEIALDEREIVTSYLTSFITRAHKNLFFLTSRPDTALGSFPNFQEFSIRGLNTKEAYELIRTYGRCNDQSLELVNRLRRPEFKSIRSFLKNPMLVSLLFVAYRHTPRLPYKKHLFYSQVYQAIFEDHDLTKDGLERYKYSKLDISDFEKILRHVAFNGARLGLVEYSYNELIDLIEKSVNYTGVKCSPPSFIKDLTNTVPIFIRDGAYYSWSHKSLQDYFSVRFMETAPGDLRDKILRRIYDSNSASRFSHILEIYREMNPRSFRQTVLRWLLEDFEAHCTSDRYDSNCSLLGDDAIKERLELTFGREISFRVYDETRSRSLRAMKYNDRVSNMLSDWADGEYFELDDNSSISHNRQRHLALGVLEVWNSNVHAILKFLANAEPDLVSRNNSLELSAKISWPHTRRVFATDPNELLNKDSIHFIAINHMLKNGLHINPKFAYEELEKIRNMESNDSDIEILEF